MSSVVKLQDKTEKTLRNLLDKIIIIDNDDPIDGTQPLKTMLHSELGLLPIGGTTGQVLKKTSETDFDIEWGVGGGSGGEPYQVSVDGSYIYFCTATNTWKRILLDTIPAP